MKMLKETELPARPPRVPIQPTPKLDYETPTMDTTFDLLDRAAEIELMRIAATGKEVPLAYNEVRGMSIALAHWSASFGRWSCLHILWVALRAMIIPVWKRQRRHFHDHRALQNKRTRHALKEELNGQHSKGNTTHEAENEDTSSGETT